MTARCHQCWNGYFHPSAERPGTLVCNSCGFRPIVKPEKAEEVRARTVDVLYEAQREIAACDFSPHSMPTTIGRVRSRIERALELLQGLA